MKLFRLLCSAWVLQALAAAQPAPPAKPKLVVAIVVDQFRYDYLVRFRKDYHAGLAKMIEGGAVFTNAHYLQMPTVTAVGHSIFLSGAMPAVSGIPGNTWFDRESAKQVTSVCDYSVKLLGAEAQTPGARCEDWDPASPRRLQVSTVGDEMRNLDERSKVIGISIKARGAILPSGHRANAAYWFDDTAGGFVSSNYYFESLPGWVKTFNSRKLADAYVDRKWDGFPEWDFHGTNNLRPYEKLPASPWGNELIELFSEAAFENEHMGQGASTDLLTVSFSSNDYVGHQTGPDAPEVRDMSIRTDQLLGKLMAMVEAKVGARNVLFVLTADHGVAPLPAVQEKRGMPGGYIHVDTGDIVGQSLNNRYGAREPVTGKLKTTAADWILAASDNSIYLNWKTIESAKLSPADAMRAARNILLATPQVHAARVYTRDELIGGVGDDMIGRAAVNGFHQGRSGDILIVQEPYYVFGSSGTSHSTPYGYDTHVPVIFYDAGVKAASYSREIAVNDIAPTLAALLGVEPPSGSSGHVLPEIVPAARMGQ